MSEYFPEPKSLEKNVKLGLDLPTGLSNLKSKVDKLDVDQLVLVSIDLS